MAFCQYISIPGFAAQLPLPLQPYAFQQPMMVSTPLPLPPQFLAVQLHQQQQVQPIVPLAMMMVSPPPPPPPPPVVIMPTLVSLPHPLTSPTLPPGAPPASAIPPTKGFKVVFFGHAAGEGRHPWCAVHASWGDVVPSRGGLLAAIAAWTGLHGLTIRHAGGRIDAAKGKLYVMPKGSSGRDGGLCGMRIVSGEGLVLPADVVRVVSLDVEETVWEDAVRDIKREGYEAIVAVDMSVSAPNSNATPAPAPDPAATATTG